MKNQNEQLESIKPLDSTPALPRVDLRREAFDRYVPFMARAVVLDIKLNPATALERPLKGSSFVARFNDAKRGARLYGYKSEALPPGFNIERLVASELADGWVSIVYLNREQQATLEMAKAELDGESQWMSEAEQKLARELGLPIKPTYAEWMRDGGKKA